MGEPFKDHVAMVTGGTRGIGRAISEKFASLGAHVAILHRKGGGASEAMGKKLCAEIDRVGRKARLIRCDISQKEQVQKAFQEVREHFGRLDFLVLNAARAPFKPIEKLFVRELKDLVNTNYLGNIFCIQQALPMLTASKGKIVFISSLGSRFCNPQYPLGSMKAAMESVVRDCSESLMEKGISVNAVCGGIVKTDSFKTLRLYWDGIERLSERFFVTPEEMAHVVMFLCGFESRGISGQTLVVDKGLSSSLFHVLGP